MKVGNMKKGFNVFLSILCSFILALNVWADEGSGQKPDYVTDYYMVVESAAGGININSEADPQSNQINDKLVANGTAFHIQGEKKGKDNKDWGYVEYHGMNGYVSMDDLRPVTPSEAAKEEYNAFGGHNVDFDVKVQTEDGSAELYRGPGEKFEKVSPPQSIANGQTVHISQFVQAEDGVNWGKADTESEEGWINLDKDTDYKPENDVVNMEANDSAQTMEVRNAQASAEVTATPTPKPTATPTPKPTATPTPKPTGTPTPKPIATPTAEATPTEAVTPTAEATPTEAVTPTAEATPTETVTTVAETTDETTETASSEEKTQKASGEDVKSSSGTAVPIIVISIIGIILIILLLWYFKKKK
ncbi:MAG: hypothetical protein PUI16_07480 [Clostridia bacterium]|nr:hypothetical protein [Clostridia bacterium]MDY5556106.1 hypothetical protein [Blautia sp.]